MTAIRFLTGGPRNAYGLMRPLWSTVMDGRAVTEFGGVAQSCRARANGECADDSSPPGTAIALQRDLI